MTQTAKYSALVSRKRAGEEHSRSEIQALVEGYCRGLIDDELFASWLHAVMAHGLTTDETAWLTDAMANSGTTIRWTGVTGTVVDKHSTGGVGDAVSLIAVPLAAACGVKVAKLSGRGLGHTGGTLDKLECIPGLTTTLSLAAFKNQVAGVGCAIAAASEDLAPADKKIYALRDRTNTVASIPLIAASVLSKKIAGGAPYLVIDVKCGRSAFMQTRQAAEDLANTILAVGSRLGRTVTVLITDMDEPLASSIGDALELDEALHVLQGHDEGRLFEVAFAVAEAMLSIRHADDPVRAPRYDAVLRHALKDGSAYARFAAMAAAQGGNVTAFSRPLGPTGVVCADRSGVVSSIDGRSLGEAVIVAMSQEENSRPGVRLRKREGDLVSAGETLAEIFDGSSSSLMVERVRSSIRIGDTAPSAGPLVIACLHAAAAGQTP